ncbi:hypothetical protein HIJ22_001547 [Escherichia coli]|nr:hypothetical protein [Escherichia coli]
MAGKATALNTNQLFMYLNRGDIADFKFSPLFTTLFFPNVATFSTQNIMLDNASARVADNLPQILADYLKETTGNVPEKLLQKKGE